MGKPTAVEQVDHARIAATLWREMFDAANDLDGLRMNLDADEGEAMDLSVERRLRRVFAHLTDVLDDHASVVGLTKNDLPWWKGEGR